MPGLPAPSRPCRGPAVALLALAACSTAHGPDTVRVATFNVSLYRDAAGRLAADLETDSDAQARRLATILRRIRPDVLLLNEIDHDPDDRALRAFQDHYLAAPDLPGAPLRYPHHFTAPVNTGVPSGLDLDGDGSRGGPGDAWGFGRYPGQYGMAVLSRWPIDTRAARTFQRLTWAGQPGNHLPETFWPQAVAARLRLSSKSHWDVPVRLPGGRTLHVLASHPTPPVFDGPEDRNGRRNHDEIRLWAQYLDAAADAAWPVDDQGRSGGLPADAAFVICGDLNADPADGDSFDDAVHLLLDHPAVAATPVPSSSGAVAAARRQGGANRHHRTPAAHDTGDFADDSGPGNLRVDYVLPCRAERGLRLVDCGVFWPPAGTPGAELLDASDHRLVWIDLR